MKVETKVEQSGNRPIVASRASDVATESITNPAIQVQSTAVALSGKSIMLSRLFLNEEPDAQPTVLTSATGLTRDKLSQSPVGFLTEADRSLVSDMYAYAQGQGSDLAYVDTFAITLGTYRKFDDGKSLGGFNDSQFDSEGHQLSSAYNASDTKAAQQILNGDAIKSTRIDTGFLHYILQPTRALSNMANVDFMKQMVTKFSDEGTGTMSLDSKFDVFSRADSASSTAVITASKEVVNKPQTSQIANIDGHWFILDPSLLQDPSALQATGLQGDQMADAKENQGIVALALLDADPKNSNDVTTKLLELLNPKKQSVRPV